MRSSTHICIKSITSQCSAFSDVLRLRSVAYARDEAGDLDPIDAHSLHFIASDGESVIGALRVTCRRNGPLESESAYPGWLLEEFGDQLCASSRMCVAPHLRATTDIPFQLTKAAWSNVLPLGVRIDVSKARLKAIPFYMRMGYCFVRDSLFEFERWSTRCGLIAYPATPHHASRLADLFRKIDNPCDIQRSRNARQFTASYSDFAVIAAELEKY